MPATDGLQKRVLHCNKLLPMNPLFSVTSVVHTYSTLLQSANYGHFNSKALKVRQNANYHSNSLGTITTDVK